LIDQGRPRPISSELAFAFEPALRQSQDQMLVGLKEQQARAAVAEGDLAQIDPIFEKIQIS
jgi:hypothetical protein